MELKEKGLKSQVVAASAVEDRIALELRGMRPILLEKNAWQEQL